MDDITLGGKSDIVANDVAKMHTLSSTLGLHLNAKKCELIQRCSIITEPAFRDFVITGERNSLGRTADGRPRAQRRSGSPMRRPRQSHRRLSLLPAYDALTLLKSSFSAPKIMHTLRCSPCHGHEALDKFDYLLRTGLGDITKPLAFRSASAGWEFDAWHRSHNPPF